MKKYAKAFAAAAGAFLGALGTGLADGSLAGSEVYVALGAALAALGVTYKVPNARR